MKTSINRFNTRNFLGAALAVCVFAFGVDAHATITAVTNGEFEVPKGPALAGTDGHIGDPWFQSSLGATDYAEWTLPSSIANGGSGRAAAFSSNTGYIYQQVGTADGNEASATLTGVVVERVFSSSTELGGALTFSIYQTPATTFGADGTFASGLPGAQIVGSGTIPDDLAAGTPININFDLSSLVAGNKVWLGVQDNLGSNNETYVDSLALEVQIAVPPAPEPSTLVLAGLGVVGLACGRRRRNRA